MAQQRDSTPPNDDIGALIDAAVNGTSAAPTTAADTATASTNQGGQDPGTDILNMVQAAKGPFAKIETISKPTMTKRDPLTGMSSETPNSQTVYRYYWGDGTYLDVSSPAGQPSAVKGGTALAALKPTATSGGTEVGTNTKDPYIIIKKPDGSTTAIENKNYVPPKEPDRSMSIPDDANPGQTKPATPQEYVAYWNNKNKQDTTDLAQQRADQGNANTIARLQQANDLANARTDLGYYQADLQNKIDQGKLSEQQAMDLFKQKVDMLTYEQTQQQNAFTRQQTAFTDQATMQQAGLAAGNQAIEAARLGTVNAVGPDFGKNYAASLTAASQGNPGGVHFGAGDFTTPMPNYAQLAQQGAAAAIAHLSPYAASITGQPSPMQPYQGMTATTAPVAGAPLAPTPANYVAPNLEGSANSTQRMAPLQPVPVPSYRPPMGAATR